MFILVGMWALKEIDTAENFLLLMDTSQVGLINVVHVHFYFEDGISFNTVSRSESIHWYDMKRVEWAQINRLVRQGMKDLKGPNHNKPCVMAAVRTFETSAYIK
jgi:hypothetical protein